MPHIGLIIHPGVYFSLFCILRPVIFCIILFLYIFQKLWEQLFPTGVLQVNANANKIFSKKRKKGKGKNKGNEQVTICKYIYNYIFILVYYKNIQKVFLLGYRHEPVPKFGR